MLVPDPSPAVPPADGAVARSGLPVAAAAWLGGVLLSAFWGVFILSATTDEGGSFVDAPLWASAVATVPLWIAMGGAPWLLARGGDGVRRELGWDIRPTDAVIGIPLGIGAQLVLVPLVYWLVFLVIGEHDLSEPARELATRADAGGVVGIVVFAVMTIVFAPITEELFYRGLVLRGLLARFRAPVAIVVSACLFGAAHFQALQFVGLSVFGGLLALLAARTGRLGPSVWTHAAFNATAVVVQLLVLR